MADDSIWKKEISFKRKPKEQADDATPAPDAEESTSLWNRELLPEVGNAAEAEAVVEETPVVEPVTDEPVAAEHVPGTVPGASPDEPVWKKEVSFSRKASQDEPVAEAYVPAEDVPGTVPEPGPDETVWKTEVSFSRKDADEDVIAEQPVPTEDVPGTVPGSGPDETVWKKEVSFERKPADAEPALAQEPMTDEDTVAADEPGVAEESVVVDDPFVFEEPVVAEEPLVAEEPAFPELVALEQPFTADPEPWNAPPALPPLPVVVEAAALNVPAPEEAVVPPLPAAELPLIPEVTETAKVPFWKKEISLGGKKGDSKPKPQKEKKGRKRKGSKEAPAVDEAPTVSVPTPEVVQSPVTAGELPPLPDETEKVPFWKKEIGGKKSDPKPKEKKERKPKASKEERAAKTKEPKQPKERKQKVPKVKTVRGVKGAKGITGLKIGASQLAAARVSNNGSAELLQVAREPLTPGIVVGGELRDPDALAEALKEFFAKNGLPKRGVRLGLANNRIGVRTFEISGITDPKQLGNAVRFRAQEALPIPIDEAVLDYQVLGEGVDGEGNPTQRILLVVAYRELIDRYVDACKKAGITLSGIDLEAFALLRALQAPGWRRQRSVCGARRRCDRARALDLRRLRRSRMRVHPRARLGRLGVERCHCPGDRRGSVRGRGLQARTCIDRRDGPRRPQRRPGEAGARGDSKGDPELRARARLLVAVLPKSARISRHRRNRAHRRDRPPAGDLRRARTNDRRARSRRRPACTNESFEEGR